MREHTGPAKWLLPVSGIWLARGRGIATKSGVGGAPPPVLQLWPVTLGKASFDGVLPLLFHPILRLLLSCRPGAVVGDTHNQLSNWLSDQIGSEGHPALREISRNPPFGLLFSQVVRNIALTVADSRCFGV